MNVKIEGKTVTYTRLIDGEIDLVFAAFSDSEHLAQWWGPDGFTLTTSVMDFKPGGWWRFTMHGPDGTDYPNNIEYVEIEKPKRIKFQNTGGNITFITTITFEAKGAQTRLQMCREFTSEAELKRIDEAHNAIEGGKQHLANLNTYVLQMRS